MGKLSMAQNETENHPGFFYLSPVLGNGKSAAQKFCIHVPHPIFICSSNMASQHQWQQKRLQQAPGLALVLCHWLQRGQTAECLGLLVASASKILINTWESVMLQGVPLISEGYFQHVGEFWFRGILSGKLFASSGNTSKWKILLVYRKVTCEKNWIGNGCHTSSLNWPKTMLSLCSPTRLEITSSDGRRGRPLRKTTRIL